MTAQEFLAWALEHPRQRCELVGGEVVAMAPERIEHTRAKAELWLALRTALKDGGLPCQAIPDGITVRINDRTVYEPDALVRCGEPLADGTIETSDPLLVAEVVSPSSRARDAGAKLDDYFQLPSLRHYLIIKTETRSIIHHWRDEAGDLHTKLHPEGVLRLEPPGISIAVADVFA